DKLNDIPAARKFFAIAAGIEAQNPSVQEFVAAVGLGDEAAMAAGSMPSMRAASDTAPQPIERDASEPVVVKTPTVETQPMSMPIAVTDAPSAPAPVPQAAPAPAPAPPAAPPSAPQASSPVPANMEDAMKAARATEGGPDK